MKRQLLSEAEIRGALEDRALKSWELKDQQLWRDYEFVSFSKAFGFMTRVALIAEKMDHHPDWSNVYSKVKVRLHTHDAGGVTALDMALAQAMESIASD